METLSDELINDGHCLLKASVEEFIRKLKEEIEKCDIDGRGMAATKHINQELDKLAGPKLISNEREVRK